MSFDDLMTEKQRSRMNCQVDREKFSPSSPNVSNNNSNIDSIIHRPKDDKAWQFLKYKFRSLSKSAERASDEIDGEQQILSQSSTTTTPISERKSIRDRLQAKFSFTFRRRSPSKTKRLLTRKAHSECHSSPNNVGNQSNSPFVAQAPEDVSGAKIAAQKKKQLLFKRQDRCYCGGGGGVVGGTTLLYSQQQQLKETNRIDKPPEENLASPTGIKSKINLSSTTAFEIGRRKNGTHFLPAVSYKEFDDVKSDWLNEKYRTNRELINDFQFSDCFGNIGLETNDRLNLFRRQALVHSKTKSNDEYISGCSAKDFDRKQSAKTSKDESIRATLSPSLTMMSKIKGDRHQRLEENCTNHASKMNALPTNNQRPGAEDAVQALTDAMSSLPSLSDSGSSNYYTPCTSSPVRSPKISFSLRKNKNKSVTSIASDMQQIINAPSSENDKVTLSPRRSFKKSLDKGSWSPRIFHSSQSTSSQNHVDQRQAKMVTWAVGSTKRPSLSRSFSTGSMTEQEAFPGDQCRNRKLSRSQEEEHTSWNISSDSTTSPDSGRKSAKTNKCLPSEASTSRLTVDSESNDRMKKSSSASMKKKRSFADPIAKKLSFLRRRPTDVNLLQLARPGADERPSENDVRSWAESFERLLQSSEGLKYFRLFLQREFSDENIEFWLACDYYKRIDDPQIRRKRSASIFKEFMAFQAPKEVNLDSSSRTATIELLNEKPDSVDVFDTAQYRIQSLMAKDSYPRFLRSDIYLNLIAHARMAEQ